MTTRDDGHSTGDESGEFALSRRDVVKRAGALTLASVVGSAAPSRTARAQAPGTAGRVTTSDGVNLHYLEAGSGKPILMIPGWSQTAEQFKYQLTGLSDRYRVIAVDMRGHGDRNGSLPAPSWTRSRCTRRSTRSPARIERNLRMPCQHAADALVQP
jgi:hypothetical protein